MEANSNSLIYALLVLCFIHLSVLEASSVGGFTLDLIHRDSPLSPFYNPSNTHTDRLRNAFLRSTFRTNHFNPSNSDSPNSIQSQIMGDTGEYLMKLSIGTPRFEILGIADTGSDLTWTQCRPCTHCYKQNAPFFVPEKSSTYRDLSCQSRACEAVSSATTCRDTDNVCQYRMSYGDNSFTIGDLAVETFTFGSTSGSPVSIPKVVFGCGHNNEGTFNESGSGIIGLGGGTLSIIKQLNGLIRGKFSYCLVPILYEGSNVTSKINFGSDAVVSGHGVVSTPLITKTPQSFYYLTLEGITVGNKTLEYYNKLSSKVEEGNIIIDSGTTLTMLQREIYNDLESTLIDVIKAKRAQDPQGLLGLCYTAQEEFDVPKITFHFTGADLELPRSSTFIKVQDDLVCLTMVPSDELAIFGNLSQMNLLVGYDIGNKKVSFRPTDCTKH